MSMELSRKGELPESLNGSNDARDTMFMMGGVALMIFGAGLVLSNPVVRRYLGQTNVGGLLSSSIPDVERYLKLRSM
jgi:hypothetical protein